MGRIFQPLLFVLARCTRNQLIRQIEFLKAENEMLRKRVPRRAIVLNHEERDLLIRLGQAMGVCIKPFITIVTYETYNFWLRKLRNQAPRKKMGRPRTPEAIRELVLKIARETGWGYTRIRGELGKLGYTKISRQTIVNILKAAGLDPNARRRPGIWEDFLHRHGETLWQCDFFSKRILSRLGLPQVYAMVFLNVVTRQVWVSPCTKRPTGAWVKKQTDAFLIHAARKGLPVGLVSRDRDKLYRNNFDQILKTQGVDTHVLVHRSPNLQYTVMGRIFQPLLFILARCTRHQLIRQIEFLKAENEMLRKRVPRRAIVLNHEERDRLIQLGQAMGVCMKPFITIVTYETYLFWLRKLRNQAPRKQMGRPRTPEAIRELVLKIAGETGWGYTRIRGELGKLGYTKISRQTIVNILKEAGLDPNARRRPGIWEDFLHRHGETLWQCDFFSKRILSRLGLPQVYAMIFLNVVTRQVWVSPCTKRPTGAWVKKQTDAFLIHAARKGLPVGLVSRDRDKLYRNNFDQILKVQGVDTHVLVHRSPNLHAFVERFIQSIQVECLDHFLVFGEKHFDYLAREFVEHYHTERPHQGLKNSVPVGEPPPVEIELACVDVQCVTRLGGLLKHYCRVAA